MTGHRWVRLALAGLLVSVAVAAFGTWLALKVGSAKLPAGSESDVRSPVFLWLMLFFSATGALVAAKRPANPIGWLLLGEGLLRQLHQLSGDLHIFATITDPGVPGGTAAAWAYEVMWVLPVAVLPLLFLLFPTGRLPSAGWRVVVGALAVGTALLGAALGLRPGRYPSGAMIDNPLGVEGFGSASEILEIVGNLLVAMTFVAGLASLVVRYRRSDATTRQQLKWLALAVGVVIVCWTTANVVEALGTVRDGGIIRTLPLLLIPVACGIAVLKYRLYDIDLVINRLFVYTGLAAFVVLLYVVVVIGVGSFVGSGDEPNLALSVAATAGAALAFDPVRRALQRVAGRAVYGRRASPYEALASMTRRVSGGYLATDVLERIARSIADATGGRAEVWGAQGAELGRWASWPSGSDESADPVHLTEPLAIAGRKATFPVRHRGQVLGAITVIKPAGEPIRPPEHRLLVDLAESAALVLENVRLVEELRSSRQRLVAAQDSERRRVERDLHDGAQQRLLELLLTLRRAQRQVAADGTSDASGSIADACQQLQQALAELRDLARGIHPAILTEQGLTTAVESLADRVAIPVALELAVDRRLDPIVESTAYFLTSEAIANIVKHAGAAEARITIKLDTGALTVEIADDGVGGADPSGSGRRPNCRPRRAVSGDERTGAWDTDPGGAAVRVILADDAVLFREGVARILAEAGVEVVGQVGDAEALLEATAVERPDAVVVDIRMPPTHTTEGLDAAARIRDSQPDVAVLVLSQYVETRHAVDLFGDRSGGVGYLLKERVTDISLLRETLERLTRNESVLDPEVVAVLLGRRAGHDPLSRLTPREREVLALMAEGRSNRGIGQSLFLSANTVETHIRNVFCKLDLSAAPDDHRRVLAVLNYLGR